MRITFSSFNPCQEVFLLHFNQDWNAGIFFFKLRLSLQTLILSSCAVVLGFHADEGLGPWWVVIYLLFEVIMKSSTAFTKCRSNQMLVFMLLLSDGYSPTLINFKVATVTIGTGPLRSKLLSVMLLDSAPSWAFFIVIILETYWARFLVERKRLNDESRRYISAYSSAIFLVTKHLFVGGFRIKMCRRGVHDRP